jgi:hypothetical protein
MGRSPRIGECPLAAHGRIAADKYRNVAAPAEFEQSQNIRCACPHMRQPVIHGDGFNPHVFPPQQKRDSHQIIAAAIRVDDDRQ